MASNSVTLIAPSVAVEYSDSPQHFNKSGFGFCDLECVCAKSLPFCFLLATGKMIAQVVYKVWPLGVQMIISWMLTPGYSHKNLAFVRDFP